MYALANSHRAVRRVNRRESTAIFSSCIPACHAGRPPYCENGGNEARSSHCIAGLSPVPSCLAYKHSRAGQTQQPHYKAGRKRPGRTLAWIRRARRLRNNPYQEPYQRSQPCNRKQPFDQHISLRLQLCLALWTYSAMLIAASGVILSARFDPPAYYPGLAFTFQVT